MMIYIGNSKNPEQPEVADVVHYLCLSLLPDVHTLEIYNETIMLY